jgi:hypothetical protein
MATCNRLRNNDLRGGQSMSVLCILPVETQHMLKKDFIRNGTRRVIGSVTTGSSERHLCNPRQPWELAIGQFLRSGSPAPQEVAIRPSFLTNKIELARGHKPSPSCLGEKYVRDRQAP